MNRSSWMPRPGWLLVMRRTNTIKIKMDFREIARKIFDGTRYHATDEDIERLSSHMVFLEERGLGRINKRLEGGGTGIWDTFVEHNFAVELTLAHNSEVSITYEPDGMRRPPDFRIIKENVTYWLQVKNLARLVEENKHEKIIQEIKRRTNSIRIGKYFSCDLSCEFKESDISNLVEFIGARATSSLEEREYCFPDAKSQKAKVAIWSPKKVALSGLTLGAAGDINGNEITSLSVQQIRQSLRNAAGAFEWEISQNVINLVAMDVSNCYDMHICEAVFGTEVDFIKGNRLYWGRQNDGLFNSRMLSGKVVGAIGMRRKKWKPNLCLL